jgi:hypothetical protein
MPDRMAENMSNKMSEYILNKIPQKRSENMANKMLGNIIKKNI